MRYRLLLLAGANIACVALVALVPLAALSGLADVAVPLSAIVGFVLVAVPAALAAAVLVGLWRAVPGRPRPLLLQLALLGVIVGLVLMGASLVAMLRDGRFDLAPFTCGALLLFAADLWVIVRAIAPRGGSSS